MIRDHDRIVWLFDKPYWWAIEEQRLALRSADWLLTPPPAPLLPRLLVDLIAWQDAQQQPAPLSDPHATL